MSSSTLPVGAFAYSQGLEYALDEGWCQTRADVETWIADNLRFGLGQLDLPIYVRCYRAWQDQKWQDVQFWNESLLAYRETKELYLEDIQVGSAYARWHLGQAPERQIFLDHCPQPTVVTMAALAAVVSGIGLAEALLGFAWSWSENQIACASKAMPMGQTDGQRILRDSIPAMAAMSEQALHIDDSAIGNSLYGLALASSLHEQQYSRLFRS
jgi:urease accessory protein